ncbi:MAG: response regulator transcription factor [Chitinophagaceae bacterium]|nr:response regulator transcription factor [Chitinophagaceae bacterium]
MQQTNYTLLSPVKEEDLRLSFGHTRTVSYSESPYQIFEPTIQHYKKLAIGTYLWFIADTINWTTVACGGAFEQLLGIEESELLHQAPQALFNRTHPEDLAQMFAFSNYWVNHFMQLPPERKPHNRATIYLRMLNASNVYNWMMVQYADQLLDEKGNILFGLTLLTNIHHIKSDGIATMSILDTYDERCQQFICVDGKSLPNAEAPAASLSNREIEVLRLLASGHSSKQIAAILQLSQKTVDNHRQNMLHKTECKSTGELLVFGIRNGYV